MTHQVLITSWQVVGFLLPQQLPDKHIDHKYTCINSQSRQREKNNTVA